MNHELIFQSFRADMSLCKPWIKVFQNHGYDYSNCSNLKKKQKNYNNNSSFLNYKTRVDSMTSSN